MLPTNPAEALQVLINTAHEAAMPLPGHNTVDALGRLVAAALRTITGTYVFYHFSYRVI